MRALLLRLVFASGLWRLWQFAHRRAVIVLTVHGVMRRTGGEAWQPLRERLAPERLDACLDTLKRHYRFVTLDAAVDMLTGRRPVEPYSMVLTFDDGYRNHVSKALPILARHGVPGVVYVCTGHAEARRPFWFDRIDYALQRAAACSEVEVAGRALPIDRSSRGALEASYTRLRVEAKGTERDDREMNAELDAIADRLEACGGARLSDVFEADEWAATLRVDEVRAAADALTFGSHTADHLRVHRVPPQVVSDQLTRSKRAIEDWTGRPCRAFCYPDGGVSPDAAALVRAAGYASAVTTDRGLNYAGDDPMLLRRMDVPFQGSPRSLLASVSGLTDRVDQFLRRLGTARR